MLESKNTRDVQIAELKSLNRGNSFLKQLEIEFIVKKNKNNLFFLERKVFVKFGGLFIKVEDKKKLIDHLEKRENRLR